VLPGGAPQRVSFGGVLKMNVLERVLQLQGTGQPGMLVTVVEKEGSGPLPAGAKMLVYEDGRTVGTVGGGALELIATRKALELLGQKSSLLAHYRLDEQNEVLEGDEATGMLCGGRISLFYEYLWAKPRLYLFGGGHVGRALVPQLSPLDFYVTVVDERAGIEATLPDADRVWVGSYERALQDELVPDGSFFVIATSSHRFDYIVLRRVLTSGWAPRYVGVIASKKKAARFLEDLKAELGADADLKPLYMPMGVDTGGSSAAEIAVSIVAEIQAVRYGRTGLRHMRVEALAQ
jgi:xanthine dehydrogenase accessory factor